MKRGKRIRHACHNEEISKVIHALGKFPDWVITTSFYAAIHFVSFKIFPIAYINNSNKDALLNTLDEYHKHNQIQVNKHEALADLVYQYFPDISPEYDWLMGLCTTARYQNYQQSSDDAERAIKLLGTIKSKLDITNPDPE